MYPLVAKKWTNQKSDLAIETAFQKEAYPENFINIGWPQAKWIHHLPTWPQGVDDIYPDFFRVLVCFFFLIYKYDTQLFSGCLPEKNLGIFYRVPFKSILRVHIKRAYDLRWYIWFSQEGDFFSELVHNEIYLFFFPPTIPLFFSFFPTKTREFFHKLLIHLCKKWNSTKSE